MRKSLSRFPLFHVLHSFRYGTHEANCATEQRRQSASQAARAEGGSQEHTGNPRREEAAPLSSGHCCPARNSPLPEVHGAPPAQTSVPAFGTRSRSRFQSGSEVRKRSDPSVAGSDGIASGGNLRGYEPLRDPREARYDYAARYAACQADPGRLSSKHHTFSRRPSTPPCTLRYAKR